ncbi:TetR/AcrR family transcriptional regulator [Lentzea rhizosphaerae]|uniref:TetR/AcrR family transcriptional regulator n=1 Tax=Lentzea rhizosphaerae TaxID=2041025 RepID=A0ABV8BP31_9PSEU
MTESTRRYRSELRQRQAAETRLRVVGAAAELFSRQGYQATTFAQLATEAGVSVETVQRHGPKSALLQAALELASFGVEGETDLFATDLGKSMLQVRDTAELAALIGSAMLAINAASAGLWVAVASAAQSDEELRGYYAHLLGVLRRQVEHVFRVFAERGRLRTDVPFDDLVEAFCVITSVETYVRFVRLDGKPDDAYTEFVARTLRETVLSTV